MNDRIPTIHEMPRDAAIDADTVSTYRMTDGHRAGMTVIEVLDAHQQVIARSIAGADGKREEIADLALDASPVERCGDWAIHPIGNGRRSTAMVSLSVSRARGTLDAMRAAHDAIA